jgi:hypothetical protein
MQPLRYSIEPEAYGLSGCLLQCAGQDPSVTQDDLKVKVSHAPYRCASTRGNVMEIENYITGWTFRVSNANDWNEPGDRRCSKRALPMLPYQPIGYP